MDSSLTKNKEDNTSHLEISNHSVIDSTMVNDLAIHLLFVQLSSFQSSLSFS
ncbi:hypothetical protein BSBH6_03516 [Bacillus subtilis]|nr:hypothetical protein BSBH6_03516 [Bacillus subtilis]RPK22255.1 hypothetical protein BH5_03520 [Bacillus subtilis]